MDQFTLEASSDLEYEKMIINLNFGNSQVAILHSDHGEDQVEIKLLDRYENKVIWTFNYESFIKALILANEKLLDINKPIPIDYGH